ncbi:MAG: sensor histidine kinase [Huintestinicola sp.]|uniref:sensor histidine kinase n=1 Tax=Huintestinicola sp. TaxID=2981661 RepID=UPI003F04C719
MTADYFRSHIKSIIVWLIICALFALVFLLYGLPVAPVLYGALLSGFFGLVFLIIDFFSYRRRRIILQRLAEEITLSADNIPLPRNGIEEEYTRLIHTLYDSLKASENEAAEKLSDMTDYYTMWVHQIKTPIAAMGLILQGGDSPEYSELSENLQRIEQYADMVLCYLRLDSDSSDLVIREYDLDGIVRQAVRKFSSQFIRRRLKLIYEPLDKTVLTDEKWLLFVVEQIISNSVKYTPSGEVEICCEEPLTLCIRDTGIGIAPEDLPRIFEKGYTGRGGRLDKKASGIGLYLCRRICGKLGHRITAESDGRGTIIKIGLETQQLEIE